MQRWAVCVGTSYADHLVNHLENRLKMVEMTLENGISKIPLDLHAMDIPIVASKKALHLVG